MLGDEGPDLIETNADTILAETGMEFPGDPEIPAIFAAAGCDVDGTRVRFAAGFCRRGITATAPAQFVQHARNPANSVQIGGAASVLCPSLGPPFAHDPDRGRRYAGFADFEAMVNCITPCPGCAIPAAWCASRSTCPPTSGISTCFMPISGIPTAPSWGPASARDARAM